MASYALAREVGKQRHFPQPVGEFSGCSTRATRTYWGPTWIPYDLDAFGRCGRHHGPEAYGRLGDWTVSGTVAHSRLLASHRSGFARVSGRRLGKSAWDLTKNGHAAGPASKTLRDSITTSQDDLLMSFGWDSHSGGIPGGYRTYEKERL